jgi:excisionase family DNA binding protein
LEVSERTIRRWVRDDVIPHVRLPGNNLVRIPADALDEWWRKRQEGGR